MWTSRRSYSPREKRREVRADLAWTDVGLAGVQTVSAPVLNA